MKKLCSIRTVVFVGSLLLQLSVLCFQSHSAVGDVDLSFNPDPSVTNPVSVVVVQPDGKVLIGGPMTFINGTNRYANARLNADGSRDNTFISDRFHPDWTHLFQNDFFNYAEVAAVAVQPDGKVVVGGIAAHTCSLGEPECQNIYSTFVTRLNANGSHDTSFTPFLGDLGLAVEQIPQVKALAVQPDGKVAVGYFGYGIIRGIVRLNANGTRDTNFNVSIGSGLGVASIVSQADGKLLMAGAFEVVNGTNRIGFARLNSNGSLDHTFPAAAGVGGVPLALQPDGKILTGGHARLNSDGSLDTGFNQVTGVIGAVRSIALQADGKLLLGGSFTTVNGVSRQYLVRLHGADSPPALKITKSNLLVTVSWPLTAGFVLDQSVTATGAWSQAVFPYVTNGNVISVSVSGPVGNKFYRLRKP